MPARPGLNPLRFDDDHDGDAAAARAISGRFRPRSTGRPRVGGAAGGGDAINFFGRRIVAGGNARRTH